MMSRTATTIHSGGGGTHSTSTRSTADLLALLTGSAALVGTGAINLHQAPEAHAAAATIPTVDCSTDKSFINTGWNGSKVLDDVTYNKDVSNGAIVDGNKLSWKGALAQGETKVITYSVTVNTPEKGNYSAENTVTPGKGGSCATGRVCATSNPIHAYTVRKSSDKKTVKAGDVINTTLRQLMLDAVITAYPDLPCLKHD